MAAYDAFDIWKEHSNVNINFEHYINKLFTKLNNNIPFSFIRLCDGEYSILYDKKSWDGRLNAEEVYDVYNALQRLIQYKIDAKNQKRNILDDQLFFGLEHGTRYVGRYKEYISALSKTVDYNNEEYPATLFSYMTVVGEMEKFFNLLNSLERPIILVGPPHLSNLKLLNYTKHIQTDLNKTWKFHSKLENDVKCEIDNILNTSNKIPIVIYSCSVSGKMLISKNYFDYHNKIVQLDLGANLDPYAGAKSREWHVPILDYYKSLERKERLAMLRDSGMSIKSKTLYQWPNEKPDSSYTYKDDAEFDKTGFNTWFNPSHDIVFKQFLTDKSTAILEIGNWAGVTTKKINQYSPNADIFIINEWNKDVDSYLPIHNAKTLRDKRLISDKLNILYENFLINCWDIKDKISIIKNTPLGGLDDIKDEDIWIDVVYVNDLYSCDDLIKIIKIVLIYWPDAVLIGAGYNSNYDNFSNKRAVEYCSKHFNVKIKNKGDIWYYDKNKH